MEYERQAEVEAAHPAVDVPLDTARTLALGFVAGLRATLPMALLARQIGQYGADIADGGWLLDLFAHRATAIAFGLSALGELLGDKRAQAPSRLEPLLLPGRIISGGTAGAVLSLAEGRFSDRGAALGAIGALVGSLGGYWFRTRVPLPRLLLAFVEDGVAIALGAWAVRR